MDDKDICASLVVKIGNSGFWKGDKVTCENILKCQKRPFNQKKPRITSEDVNV